MGPTSTLLDQMIFCNYTYGCCVRYTPKPTVGHNLWPVKQSVPMWTNFQSPILMKLAYFSKLANSSTNPFFKRSIRSNAQQWHQNNSWSSCSWHCSPQPMHSSMHLLDSEQNDRTRSIDFTVLILPWSILPSWFLGRSNLCLLSKIACSLLHLRCCFQRSKLRYWQTCLMCFWTFQFSAARPSHFSACFRLLVEWWKYMLTTYRIIPFNPRNLCFSCISCGSVRMRLRNRLCLTCDRARSKRESCVLDRFCSELLTTLEQ